MLDLQCQAPSAEERLLWEEEVTGLLAGLAELSEKDRQVIALSYGSELSTSDVGAILGVRRYSSANEAVASAHPAAGDSGQMKDRSEQLRELDNRLRSVRFQPRLHWSQRY